MKDLALQRSFLQTVEIGNPNYKNYYALRKLFGDYFNKLHVAFYDECCPTATEDGVFPVRYSGGDVQYFNGTTWVSSGAVASLLFGAAGQDDTAAENRSFNSTGFTFGVAGLPSSATANVVYYNSVTGQFTYGATPSSPTITASQGLTRTGDDIALGGTLTTSKSIAISGSSSLSLTGSQNATLLSLTQSGNGTAITASNAGGGNAIQASGQNGNGVFATSNNIPLYAVSNPASSTGSQNVLRLDRTNSGGAGADDIACALAMYCETSNSTSQLTGLINAKLTTANTATRTSTLELHAVLNTAQQVIASFGGGGNIRFAQGLQDFADDTAAGAGGIAVTQLYRTGSVVKIRVA